MLLKALSMAWPAMEAYASSSLLFQGFHMRQTLEAHGFLACHIATCKGSPSADRAHGGGGGGGGGLWLGRAALQSMGPAAIKGVGLGTKCESGCASSNSLHDQESLGACRAIPQVCQRWSSVYTCSTVLWERLSVDWECVVEDLTGSRADPSLVPRYAYVNK